MVDRAGCHGGGLPGLCARAGSQTVGGSGRKVS
jgi:hypothetical protein